MIIGDEGIGKSLLWIWMTAIITTGRQARTRVRHPRRRTRADIIVAITEDDWCTAVRPRLEITDEDLSMIRVICADPDGSRTSIFPRDLELITAKTDPRPDLVVVDAWLDTVPAGLKVRDPQQARLALHPWKDLATVTNAAISLICHTNRVRTANARDRYGATIELRKKARMSLSASRPGPTTAGSSSDPESQRRRHRARVKCSPSTSGTGSSTPPPTTTAPCPDSSTPASPSQTARQHLAESFAAGHDSQRQRRHDGVARY